MDQVHTEGELLGVQLPLLLDVGQVPDVGQDVLRQSGLEEKVLDLHPRDESVLVAVSLFEERLVPQSVPSVDHPGNSLEVVDGSCGLRGEGGLVESRG